MYVQIVQKLGVTVGGGGSQICLVIGCYVPMTKACFLRHFDFANLSFQKTLINALVLTLWLVISLDAMFEHVIQ